MNHCNYCLTAAGRGHRFSVSYTVWGKAVEGSQQYELIWAVNIPIIRSLLQEPLWMFDGVPSSCISLHKTNGSFFSKVGKRHTSSVSRADSGYKLYFHFHFFGVKHFFNPSTQLLQNHLSGRRVISVRWINTMGHESWEKSLCWLKICIGNLKQCCGRRAWGQLLGGFLSFRIRRGDSLSVISELLPATVCCSPPSVTVKRSDTWSYSSRCFMDANYIWYLSTLNLKLCLLVRVGLVVQTLCGLICSL